MGIQGNVDTVYKYAHYLQVQTRPTADDISVRIQSPNVSAYAYRLLSRLLYHPLVPPYALSSTTLLLLTPTRSDPLQTNRRDFTAAEALYRRALQLDPGHVPALAKYGRLLEVSPHFSPLHP